MQTTDLISTTEAAALLGVDRTSVTRYAAAGHLPVAIQAPGQHGAKFFRRSDVEALAAARRGDAA